MENELDLINNEDIKNLIYNIREKQNVEVVILTSNKSNILKLDVQKFNKEYPVLKIAKTNKFHDRFIVIDNKELYHLRSINKGFREKMLWD